jgi:vitamin B12 transporter
MALGRSAACIALLLPLILFPATSWSATAEESSFLSLYFSKDELEVFSATRSLKSVASIAENVTVVTEQDIELMNAHTVAEALYNVTGIEMQDFKGPGSGGFPSIHGSGSDRVTVMLDGVPISAPNNTFPLATLPVQMVRKIEVIKGPASSTWGSSFGGVINVITKSVASGDRVDGMGSASIGAQNTSDVRAELSARKDPLGIYLYGGRIDSDGLQDGHEFTHENFFGKVNLDAGRKTRLDLSFFYHTSDSVSGDLLPTTNAHEGFELETLYGKADLWTSFAENIDLNLSTWALRNNDNSYEHQLNTDVRTRDAPLQYDRYGFSGNLAWRTGNQLLVAGGDWSSARFETEVEPQEAVEEKKYALFVNDTLAAGTFNVTPGLRYDHSSQTGGLVSPSLGVTYLVSRDLLFRALVSRGFHDLPILRYLDAPAFGYRVSEGLEPERIWSYQAGVEVNVADLVRAKLTLFYHDIDDILIRKPLESRMFTWENAGRAKTVGGEFEIATNTFEGFVLKGGVHYEQTERIDYSDLLYFDVRNVYGVNATLDYDDARGLKGTVRAHYLWWDMTEFWGADSGGVVVDLSIARRLLDTGKIALDVFAVAHNIFDANSYNNQFYENPGRWLEAGVRCPF